MWNIGLDEFSIKCRTCSAHLRCPADKNSRVVSFTGWRAFLIFSFLFFFSSHTHGTTEALPRQNEHLSPGLPTNDRGGGNQHPKHP